jgi:hypothetical protein
MGQNFEIEVSHLFIFMAAWYIQMTVTYGTNVPAGLFLPGMIVGSALGEIMARTLKDHTAWGDHEPEDVYQNTRKHFVVLGCGSVLAGYTRMTYSLAVILMETSQSLSLFIPIIFTIVVSNQVGALFTRSLYQRACRGKQMPILIDKVPRPCRKIIAEDMMASEIVTLNCVETIEKIKEAIMDTSHHGFPVLNSNKECIGVIPRNFIVVLLSKQWWYDPQDKG